MQTSYKTSVFHEDTDCMGIVIALGSADVVCTNRRGEPRELPLEMAQSIVGGA